MTYKKFKEYMEGATIQQYYLETAFIIIDNKAIKVRQDFIWKWLKEEKQAYVNDKGYHIRIRKYEENLTYEGYKRKKAEDIYLFPTK